MEMIANKKLHVDIRSNHLFTANEIKYEMRDSRKMKLLIYSGPADSTKIVERVLSSKFHVKWVDPDPERLLPEFEKCTVFLDASMKVPIRAECILKARNLRLIVTATTGANHIDQEVLTSRGIPLLTLKGQTEVLRNLTPAAEHSWLLLMACARRLRGAIDHVEGGHWERTEFPGIVLKNKTIGIIGMGRIGTWMARYASAFDMRVLGYDPFVSSFPSGVIRADLNELLSSSDFICVHVNLTNETRGMLTSEKINKCKRGCVLINTSRGELIDEAALVKALKNDTILAVGVDVLEAEPDITKSPLWMYSQDHPNVIITPHVGGFCPEAVNWVVEFSCRRILEYFSL
jgi:phosphoglycerate dehydrogenase-like enzyme